MLLHPVARFSKLILALLVPIFLASCASEPRIVERVRTVEVRVPVVQPIPVQLVADCPPDFAYPERVTVNDIVSRVVSLEAALSICRDQIAKLRK